MTTASLGGFKPFEKYQSTWIISPGTGRGENKKYLKPPRYSFAGWDKLPINYLSVSTT